VSLPTTFLGLQTDVAQKAHMNLTDDGDRIKDWINTSYAEVASTTRCFQRSATSTLVSGTSSYTLDASVLHIELLTVTHSGSAWFPLKECELEQILSYRALNSAASGPPTSYALVGLNQLELWPTPNSADTLTTWYSYLPTYLAADGDVPALPEPHASNLLSYGALVQAAEAKRDIMMLGDFQSQYAASMQDFQRYLNRKAGAYPRSFPTWTSTTTYGPHDPSADVWGWNAA